MNSSITLGQISGIKISIHPTWIIAFVFIAWTISSLFDRSFQSWSATQYWTGGVIGSLALFISVLAHELAHSMTALRLGLPVDGITLFIFGGVSRITGRYARARDEFLVAFSGPLSSLIIGGIALLAYRVFRPEVGDPGLLLGVLFYLGYMNILLGIFNLLPGFPLDGGRVLRSMVWGWTSNESRATNVATAVGNLVAWGLIGIGLYWFIEGDFIGGIWMAFIGLFLQSASRGERRAEQARTRLGGVDIRPAIQRTPAIANADETVDVVMRRVVGTGFQHVVPVVDDGVPIGFFTAEDAARFAEREWPNLSVGSVIRRHMPYTVGITGDAIEVLDAMQARGAQFAIVLSDDTLVGVVGLQNLEALIRFRRADAVEPPGHLPS